MANFSRISFDFFTYPNNFQLVDFVTTSVKLPPFTSSASKLRDRLCRGGRRKVSVAMFLEGTGDLGYHV